MGFAMMAPAQRHGELIADLAAERAALREAQIWASAGVRPQIRPGCLATNLTCSLSRSRRGSGWANRLLSMLSAMAVASDPTDHRSSDEDDSWGADSTGDNGWSLTSPVASSVASFAMPRVGCSQTKATNPVV